MLKRYVIYEGFPILNGSKIKKDGKVYTFIAASLAGLIAVKNAAGELEEFPADHFGIAFKEEEDD